MDLILFNKVIPVVNQLEMHPLCQRGRLRDIMKEYNVVPMAWAPLAECREGIMTNPTLVKIAEKHKKSVAQVILRWDVQSGMITIPKSKHKSRIVENIALWDFALDEADMAEIATIDGGKPLIRNHHSADYPKGIYNYRL